MPIVTVTGRVWDHMRTRISPALQPELAFVPVGNRIVGRAYLETNGEVLATLDSDGDTFTIDLEGDAWYTPVFRHLSDPSQAVLSWENRAFAYYEFPKINSGSGGPIGNLPSDPIQINGIWYGHGNPPSWLTHGIYVDISGAKPVFIIIGGQEV